MSHGLPKNVFLWFSSRLNTDNKINNTVMSLASKLTLGACCAISASIIIYVHYKQEYDRSQLHLGVEKDLERQRRRKIENTYILQQQSELTKELQRDLDARTKDLGTALPS